MYRSYWKIFLFRRESLGLVRERTVGIKRTARVNSSWKLHGFRWNFKSVGLRRVASNGMEGSPAIRDGADMHQE